MYNDSQEVQLINAIDIKSLEVQLINAMAIESLEVHSTSAFPSPHLVGTPQLPAPASFFYPVAITSTPLSPPAAPKQHAFIFTILKDKPTSYLLKSPLPFTFVIAYFTLSAESEQFIEFKSIAKVVIGLLGLAVLASYTVKVQKEERPVLAAVAEVAGSLLLMAAFIYPMSYFMGGPILWIIPPIIGVVALGMYGYRLATVSGGDSDGASV